MRELIAYKDVHTEHQNLQLNREVKVLISHPEYKKAVKAYTEAKTIKDLSQVPVCGAMIDINSRCNFHCLNCIDQASVNQNHLPTEMPWPVLRTLVLDLHALGCRFIEPMGGETMLYSAYDRFLDLSTKLNIALKIVSNGSLAHLHIPALVAASQVTGSSIRFSVNGDETTHRLLTRTQNPDEVFKQVLENIELLSKKGVRVLVSYVVFVENVTTIYSTAKYVKERGASEFLVLPGRDWQTKKVLITRNTALERELDRAKLLGDEHFYVNVPQTFSDGGGIQRKPYGRCASAFFKPVIGVKGHLYPCSYFKQREDLILGQVNSAHPFKEVWRSQIRAKKLMNMRPDKECTEIDCTRHYLNCFVDGLNGRDIARTGFTDTPLPTEVFF